MLHIFIVSLQQDVEKRETISKTLNDFNLDFTFIDAVYGRELPNEYLDYLRDKSSGKLIDRGFPATPGEIGCTLSHLKAYQEVIDRGLEWACILEDDAILDERFKVFIKNFDSSNLSARDLYLLGGQNGFSDLQVIKSKKNKISIGRQSFSKTIKSEQFIYRTCCYLISASLASSLLELSECKFLLADDWDYLVKVKFIEEIYLSNFIDHPLDLSVSNLEAERKIGREKVHHASGKKKLQFFQRLKTGISCRARLILLNSYRLIEKKDS